ncbi:MAG TPA: cytochrome c family protein [Caulobacteraceae bacterium]|nr:cytochrome c family protein [Caulobacteraceae bacterium]
MSDDLGFNKIAGAVLATGLVIAGLNQVAAHVYEPELAKKEGMHVEAAVDTGAESNKPDIPPDWGTVLPTADVAAGQAIFAKCSSCHKPTDENGTGPGLNGILGRKPASHPGFAYSAAMTDFGAKQPIWDYEHVYEFIKGPQKYIAGTKMTFAGLKKQEDRINVIAYLHTLNSSLPVPAPNPAAAAAAAAAAAGPATNAPATNAPATNAPAGAKAGEPTSTGSTAQAGQPKQAPTTGPAAAPTQMPSTPGGKLKK